MILVDANLLVYARATGLPQHVAAHTWLDKQLNGEDRVALPWSSLLAFLRIVTNVRMYEKPDSIHDAWQQVEQWLECPNVWVPEPGDRHRAILARLLAQTGASGNLVPDAHLAAIAIEHGLTLCSSDGDFARFEGLRWNNPLAR